VAEGTCYLGTVVDYGGKVTESDEANNTMISAQAIGIELPLPDLGEGCGNEVQIPGIRVVPQRFFGDALQQVQFELFDCNDNCSYGTIHSQQL
jgi:hypothetical protein